MGSLNVVLGALLRVAKLGCVVALFVAFASSGFGQSASSQTNPAAMPPITDTKALPIQKLVEKLAQDPLAGPAVPSVSGASIGTGPANGAPASGKGKRCTGDVRFWGRASNRDYSAVPRFYCGAGTGGNAYGRAGDW